MNVDIHGFIIGLPEWSIRSVFQVESCVEVIYDFLVALDDNVQTFVLENLLNLLLYAFVLRTTCILEDSKTIVTVEADVALLVHIADQR